MHTYIYIYVYITSENLGTRTSSRDLGVFRTCGVRTWAMLDLCLIEYTMSSLGPGRVQFVFCSERPSKQPMEVAGQEPRLWAPCCTKLHATMERVEVPQGQLVGSMRKVATGRNFLHGSALRNSGSKNFSLDPKCRAFVCGCRFNMIGSSLEGNVAVHLRGVCTDPRWRSQSKSGPLGFSLLGPGKPKLALTMENVEPQPQKVALATVTVGFKGPAYAAMRYATILPWKWWF